MSTELGAFAVLSSLLLYLADLVSSHPQVQKNKAKWLENIENKVNLRHGRQSMNSGIRPTKFQLLQSRFMNNNREPYRKKAREVGKLVIKEKQSANRNGLSSIVSKLEKRSLAEESPAKTPQEKVKWVGSCGKNTVKNILKKFMAAEEKEVKEKQQPAPKKKALNNNNLPKIINKNSVLSKLKEKFEQTSNLCSAIEVKALLPCTGEIKSKKVPEKKAIRKAQIRLLQADLRTTTHFNSPQPQQVACKTAPTPEFRVATEISHPWSWATNARCTTQLSDSNTVGTKGSQKTQHIWPGGKRTPEGTANEGQQQEGWLQNKHREIMPKVVTDNKDTVANDMSSGSPGTNPGSLPPSCESQSPAGCIPTLSKDRLDHQKNVMPPVDNVFSSSGEKNAADVISKGHLSTTCPPCSLTERPSAPSCQEIKRSEIPGIPEGMCRPKETEIELAEPIRDSSFASQKSFPDQKLVENIPPFGTPVAQASCNTAPPGKDDLQSSAEPPAVDQTPPLKSSQVENAQDFKGKCSDAVQSKEKLPQKKEAFPNSTQRGPVSTLKQKEPRPVTSQGKPGLVESELLPQKPHSQQNKDISSPSLSKHMMSQENQAPTSNYSQKEKTDHIEAKMCYEEFEKHLSPVSSDLVISSCAAAVENIDKGKSCSVNEIPNPENETEINHLDTSQVVLEEVINHELHNLEENSRPASKKCHSSSLDHSGKPVGSTTEDNRPWCGVGKFQKPSSLESIKKESCMKKDKVTIPNLEKLHLPSPNEQLKPNGTPGGDNKSTHNLPSCSDANNSENNAAEDKGASHQTEGYRRRPSAKQLREHENKTAGATSPLSSMKKHPMPLVNEPGKQESKTVMAEEKSQKNNLPSQNEMLMQECSSAAEKRKEQKAAAQHATPSIVDRREQKDRRAGEKRPIVESEKMGQSSMTAQKSIKNNLAKDGDGITTENNISQTRQLTPSKHKANSPGVLHSPPDKNSKYQTISRDPAKHGGVRAGDEKDQLSSLKEPVKHDNNGEGRNAQHPLKNGKMMSPVAKAKSESKTGKKQDNCSHSGQNQLPLKNELPKSEQNSAREMNTLSNLKKDQKPSSKELKTEQTNPAVEEPRKISVRDSGKPVGVPKDEKHAPGNCQLPLSDVKLESLQNNAAPEKPRQQHPQLSKAYVNPKPSIRDEKQRHGHSERHRLLPSSDEMEMHENKAAEKKGSLTNSDKCRAPVPNHDRPLGKKKTEYKTDDAQPKLCSSSKAHPAEQEKTPQSSSKYQILSSRGASGPGSEETQKYGAGRINENQARLVNLEKYKAESYSEEPTIQHASFKPIVIRAIDTIKLDN